LKIHTRKHTVSNQTTQRQPTPPPNKGKFKLNSRPKCRLTIYYNYLNKLNTIQVITNIKIYALMNTQKQHYTQGKIANTPTRYPNHQPANQQAMLKIDIIYLK